MDLDELLQNMDRAAANLAKLDRLWRRAQPMIPSGPSRGSSREYEDLQRSWRALRIGLPSIDGWTVTEELPDEDSVGAAFVDYAEIGEHPFALMNDIEEPGRQLDEYRFRLGQARRRAIRDRLEHLISTISEILPVLVDGVPRDSPERIEDARTTEVASAIAEIERLLGDTVERGLHWSALARHMHFSQGQDWHDIVERDWPSVRADIMAAIQTDSDPLPVPDIDLGVAASSRPSGGASTGLNWGNLTDDGFERLLFDLLHRFSSYQNVEWLLKTNAPDRGRDISAERVIRDESGTVRTERTIIQAKHWQSKSVSATEITTSLAPLPTWEPPRIRTLVIATSGRFTADAVAVVDRHNDDANRPFIELWANSKLETLLSQHPDLIASYGLRD